MNLILNIDTATEIAHVSIAKDGIVLKDMFNEEQKTHAGFLQPAIKKVLQDTGIALTEISAVAVTEGPGSYTGLRIGMASAKGLCYAINKPLITINTLELLANATINKIKEDPIISTTIFCPMIDARRMEVYAALYDCSLKNILSPLSVILDKNSFEGFLKDNPVIFFGNGAGKWKTICYNKNAFFQNITITSASISELAAKKMNKGKFEDLIYSEPFYVKEFNTKGW
jgi:tRNA threonylcarbamoyladenosine biosynthesis protein TsaB